MSVVHGICCFHCNSVHEKPICSNLIMAMPRFPAFADLHILIIGTCTGQFCQHAGTSFSDGFLCQLSMQAMPAPDFIGILRPAFQADEWKLILVGGILGAAAGAIQQFALFDNLA